MKKLIKKILTEIEINRVARRMARKESIQKRIHPLNKMTKIMRG